VNGAEAGTVAGSHVLVQGFDGVGSAEFTELLVHVVGAGARVVTDPDTEVLDLGRTLLGDLCDALVSSYVSRATSILGYTYDVEADDFTVGLLDLLQLGEEVPETRLGHNCVRGEDAHAVQLGRRVRLGRQVTPDDLVLVETT
jgi:hypothetical protein